MSPKMEQGLSLERSVKRTPRVERVKESRKTNPEEVWALWVQYTNERKELAGMKESPERIGKQARLSRMLEQLSGLWHTLSAVEQQIMRERVFSAPNETAAWEQHDEPAMAIYEKNTARRAEIRRLLAERDAERYAKNGALDDDEFAAIEEADLRHELHAIHGYLDELLEPQDIPSPETLAVMERFAFERISTYAEQLHKENFAWTPSRELLADAITKTMLTSRRPIFLAGASGTGKTQLVRAIARRLTGRDPFEVGEEGTHDIEPLLGTKSSNAKGETFITYGPLGRALTGKENSLQTTQGEGGIFYLDEANGYPPQALRVLVKRLAGKKPGDTVTFGSWEGQEETVANGFRFVMAGNLKDERHQDRNELPPELVRDLELIEVGYTPQKELHEVALGSLMDTNKRIRFPMNQCGLAYRKPEVQPDGTVMLYPDFHPASGSPLWKFVSFVAKNNAVYDHKDTLPLDKHLDSAILDPGKALQWLISYRKGVARTGETLGAFLDEQLNAWMQNKTFTEDDRAALVAIRTMIGDFDGFEEDEMHTKDVEPRLRTFMVPHSVPMSNRDIAHLSPYVPIIVSPLEKNAPQVDYHDAMLEDGTRVQFTVETVEHLVPGKTYVHDGKALVFQGVTKSKEGMVFLIEDEGMSVVVQKAEALQAVEKLKVLKKRKTLELNSHAEQEMMQLFGQYYFGAEALEKTCTFMNGTTSILRLTADQKRAMQERLSMKLTEPDVLRFIERLKSDPAERAKWMLLNVPELPPSMPFSILSLTESLDADARRQPTPTKLVHEGNSTNRLNFFRANPFASEHILPGAWFVSKDVLAGTTNKTQDQQTALLQAEATRLGFAPSTWKRTHPTLRFLSLMENFKVNRERLMGSVYDRSDMQTAAGSFAIVGSFGADGVFVTGDGAVATSSYGASLTR